MRRAANHQNTPGPKPITLVLPNDAHLPANLHALEDTRATSITLRIRTRDGHDTGTRRVMGARVKGSQIEYWSAWPAHKRTIDRDRLVAAVVTISPIA